MIRLLLSNILIFFFSLFCFNAYGQKDTAIALSPIEVHSQRLYQFSLGQVIQQSDSVSMQIAQNQRIDNQLPFVAPLSIKSYGTGISTLSMRGLGTNHTAMLWNGINLQNPLNGLFDLNLLEVGATQRIGLLLGGSSTLGGSGAIGGMVLLDDVKTQRYGWHGQIGMGYGTTDWLQYKAAISYENDRISFAIRGNTQRATNNFEYRNIAAIGQPIEKAVNADYILQNFNGHIFWTLSPKNIIKVHAWRTQNRRGLVPTMTAATEDAVLKDTSNRVVGEWLHFLPKGLLKTRFAYIRDNNFYNSDNVKNSQNGIFSYIAETEWNHTVAEKYRIRVGINNTQDVSNNNNYASRYNRNRFAIFVNNRLETKYVVLSGSIRQEWIAQKGTPITFSAGAEKDFFKRKSAQKTSNRYWARANLSRNFSVASFNDLYWAELGNPELKNELGISKEIGFSMKQSNGNQYFEAHLTYFDVDVSNRILWKPQANGQWRPSNLYQMESNGLEFMVKYVAHLRGFNYQIATNYQVADATDSNGKIITYVPRQSASVNGRATYKNFLLSWQQSISSRRYADSDKTEWTNGFTVAQATGGYSFSLPKLTKLSLQLDISNIFNSDYQTILYYPNPKRQYRFQVYFDF